MSTQRYTAISKIITPIRVFIALMLAVIIWLAPLLFRSEP